VKSAPIPVAATRVAATRNTYARKSRIWKDSTAACRLVVKVALATRIAVVPSMMI